jgi:hypothetical protein
LWVAARRLFAAFQMPSEMAAVVPLEGKRYLSYGSGIREAAYEEGKGRREKSRMINLRSSTSGIRFTRECRKMWCSAMTLERKVFSGKFPKASLLGEV